MKPILYYDDKSPPVRSVLMLINKLDIDVEYKFVDLFKAEHLRDEYIKISPTHTVPALKHNDIIITDSHAILIYLVEEFGSESNLYPQDKVGRMKVLEMLFFNGTNLFRKDSDTMSEIVAKSPKDISHHLDKIIDGYEIMERFIHNSNYMAGNYLTIADISIVATLSTLNLVQRVDVDKFPFLTTWFNRMRKYPFYTSGNLPGLEKLRDVLQELSNFAIESVE